MAENKEIGLADCTSHLAQEAAIDRLRGSELRRECDSALASLGQGPRRLSGDCVAIPSLLNSPLISLFFSRPQKYTEICIEVGRTFAVNNFSEFRQISEVKKLGGAMIDMVNGTVEVLNPAEILRNEDGVFEVTSPFGHVFRVTCRRGARMSVREISEPQRVSAAESVTWRIKRVARAVA